MWIIGVTVWLIWVINLRTKSPMTLEVGHWSRLKAS